ncbi:MAG: helix-turn-helix transcriptional regulator [Gammaproteobacteria bacterium]|nr:MAG: helix-turn-helix transcriptional regulator [Gammaproteobacteria bacterium]
MSVRNFRQAIHNLYRRLIQAGPEGLAASESAERLGIPANTLSFHLKTLSHAHLVHGRPDGPRRACFRLERR